ncbi:MAG: EpsG family protein [Lachnospiraceae bacterium]|nr:EpsG family protein [Lachnospiraceae bacterium]
MGVIVYWYLVAAVIIIGMILPQERKKRKKYIVIIGLLHTFLCGFRYMYITGDLRKYAFSFYEDGKQNNGWFDVAVFNGGKNAGFRWFSKCVSIITNGDFQLFLIILAIITQVSMAIIIYYYSPKPWLSYLIFNTMSFYVVYDFCAIKQGLAMSLLLFSMIAIFEKKFLAFLIITLIAGFVHFPALAFLPAYIIANNKINNRTFVLYSMAALLIYLSRNAVVSLISEAYYEEEIIDTNVKTTIGGRFIVITLILLCGIILKGINEKRFEQLFNVIFVGALLQMFSGFDNVFTRFADYYLQFLVLFIPMIFFRENEIKMRNEGTNRSILTFDEKSNKLFVAILTLVLLWYYYKTCLGMDITIQGDNYLNYRFMWQVK